MSRFITALFISAAVCAAQSDSLRQAAEQDLAAKLQLDPNNVPLLLKLGALKVEDAGSLREGDARTAALNEAQSYYERVVAIDSSNTTALYSLGVQGWMRVFPELRTARAQLSMEPETPGPLRDRATRAVLNAKYARTLTDSIGYLERVVAIDPQSNDSMAYLNLVFRAKADLDDTAEAYSEDIATADRWVHKALETARARQGAGMPFAPPPPPPPPLPGSPAAARIRVGGAVQASNLIHKVDPVYPEMAQRARIQGTVRFNSVIAKDGTMANLTVVSGHPMLIQAALEAVKQWIYKPTLLNGDPVEVVTTIDVDFALP